MSAFLALVRNAIDREVDHVLWCRMVRGRCPVLGASMPLVAGGTIRGEIVRIVPRGKSWRVTLRVECAHVVAVRGDPS